MKSLDWAALADRLSLDAGTACLRGQAGRYPAGLTVRNATTWLGLVVPNPARHRWTLTRRWEPQARAPRRPDATTVKFRDRRLTERYVGVAENPAWFRDGLGADAVEALVHAADANRLGACSIQLRDHLLTARYRVPAPEIPDLSETLAALEAAASSLDPAAEAAPDPAVRPLLRMDASDVSASVTRVAVTGERLVGALPRVGGLRARLRPAPQVVVDWRAQTVTTGADALPLDTLRQVLLATVADVSLLLLIDVAGAVVFAGRVGEPLPGPPLAPAVGGPPLVFARAGLGSRPADGNRPPPAR